MNKHFQLDRRSCLGSALALGLTPALRTARISAQPARPPVAPDEFKRRLRGPIVSIPTPFTADSKVDHQGVRTMIRRALDHSIEIFCLTAGDSQFSFLSYEEIKELTRVVAEAVGDKGMTIAGTGPWWTDRAIDFARHAESVGVTAVMVLLPPGGDEDGLFMHYQQIACRTRLPIVLHGNYPTPLLQRLLKIDSIAALKEDVSEHYFVETAIHFGQRLNCFSGGSYEYFVVAQPYGATAYFDTYSTFAPEISVRFWKAVQANDYAAEREIIEKYDHPLIYHEFSHPFWHATLEYFGVAGRYMRAPQHTYTNDEMKKVKAFFDERGLYPEKPSA